METEYLIKLNTSVYDSIEYKNKLFIAGSDWNRRKVKYTKDIPKNSKGKASIFNNKQKLVKEIEFPSMIYKLYKLPTNNIFVGSKSGKSIYNLMDLKGNIIKTRDDKQADGMIVANYNPKKKEIIVTTRNGYVKILSEKILKEKEKLRLFKTNRTWGLYFDVKKQIIYVGDYEGNLYIINRSNMKLIKKINFKQFFKKNQEFGPSIWGLSLLSNSLLITTRWNKLFKMDIYTYKIKPFLDIKEDICDVCVYKKNILIGTRYGKLYLYRYYKRKIKENKRNKTNFAKRKCNLGN